MLAQSSDKWESLIGDDGSEDDSLEEACAYLDSRIRVLSQSRNRGKAIMMNRLLFEAKGRYILELMEMTGWHRMRLNSCLTRLTRIRTAGWPRGGMDAGNEPGSSVPYGEETLIPGIFIRPGLLP